MVDMHRFVFIVSFYLTCTDRYLGLAEREGDGHGGRALTRAAQFGLAEDAMVECLRRVLLQPR